MFGSQLRSVIEWKNVSPEVVIQKWSDNGDEIKNASKLLVGPGQGCLFIYEGKVQATYANEGLFELKTANIPFWTTITKFMQNFVSEHKVGLYFYKRTQLTDLRWGTPTSVKYEDPKYKFPVGLRAFGNFSTTLQKPDWFMQNVTSAVDVFTVDQLRELMASRILQPLTTLMAESKFSFAEIDSQRTNLAAALTTKLNDEYSRLGLALLDFRIEGTSFDDDTMKRINRIADMTAEAQAAGAAGLTYAQLQQLDALKEAAKNPGGAAGAGVGLGVGLGLGQQMASAMGGMNDDATSKLKKIKDMLDQGLITKDEFDAKKKDILSKI